MQIIMPAINFQGHPLIWEYEKKTNQVSCLFILTDTAMAPDKSELIAIIANIPGIEITSENDAVIKDAQKFFKTYEMKAVSSNNQSHFFSTGRKRKIQATSVPKLVLNQSAYSEDFDAEVKPGIWINTLFPRTPASDLTKWSHTRAHEGYFASKTTDDATNRQLVFYTESGIVKAQQYVKNRELYPIKTEQMRLLRQLFDEILAPIYDNINAGKAAPPQLIAHLQNAVEGVMLNERFNKGPTEYETMSLEELEEKFKSDKSELDFAITEIRRARARIMLRPLLYFISNINLKIADEVKTQLELLKQEVTSNEQTIKRILEELEQLIINSGKTEYKFDCLMDNSKTQITQKANIIGDYYSCYHLINSFQHSISEYLPEKKISSKEKKKRIQPWDPVQDIIQQTIQMIRQDNEFGNSRLVVIPASEEKDFYFSKELGIKLKLNMAALFKQGLPKNMKNKPKLPEFIIHFIKEELNNRLTVEERPISERTEPLVRGRKPGIFRTPTPSARLEGEPDKYSGYFSN